LAHPILETLKSTDKAWLVDLLYAFNTGDIVLFEQMKPQWMNIPDLATQELKLRQKISLLCLMEVRIGISGCSFLSVYFIKYSEKYRRSH